MFKLDRKKISTPKITFSKEAERQIRLILENDFTIKEKYFRIQINGKGCDGFQYAVGFSAQREDDIVIEKDHFKILTDPFTAFYLKEGFVDYIFRPYEDKEGFVILNKDQKKYEGKFWKEDISKIPPLIQ